MDRYRNFEALKSSEQLNVDYRIQKRMGSSGIAILCIHGGDIEPGTSCIADAIAGQEHSFYAFEGIKHRGNLALHITSTRFDESSALEIVCRSDVILSIHGCAKTEPVVNLGGLDAEIKRNIMKNLCESGFQVNECAGPPFGGLDRTNICNLCGRGMGVQMEISRGLREWMFRSLEPEGRRHRTEIFDRFINAVRDAISPFAAIYAETHPLQGTD